MAVRSAVRVDIRTVHEAEQLLAFGVLHALTIIARVLVQVSKIGSRKCSQLGVG